MPELLKFQGKYTRIRHLIYEKFDFVSCNLYLMYSWSQEYASFSNYTGNE